MKICLPLCLVGFLFVSSFPQLHAEEVRNGDFIEGARFWFVLVNGGFRDGDALTPHLHAGGEGLHLNVKGFPEEKDKPAAVTVNQRLRTLSEGQEYVLKFEAKGKVGEFMLVGIGNPVESGPNRGNLTGALPVMEVTMEEDWKKVEYSFVYNVDQSLKLPDDSADTLLQFRVGTLGDFYLRGVSVVEK